MPAILVNLGCNMASSDRMRYYQLYTNLLCLAAVALHLRTIESWKRCKNVLILCAIIAVLPGIRILFKDVGGMVVNFCSTVWKEAFAGSFGVMEETFERLLHFVRKRHLDNFRAEPVVEEVVVEVVEQVVEARKGWW